jgi:hypothetical protein
MLMNRRNLSLTFVVVCALVVAGCQSLAAMGAKAADKPRVASQPVVATSPSAPSDIHSGGEAAAAGDYVTREEAIKIAADQLVPDSKFEAAEHGAFVDMWVKYVHPGRGRIQPFAAQQGDREVWAVTFSGIFDNICPPDGSPCLPPRPGRNTVMVDYTTGEAIAGFAVAPNPNPK